MMVRRFPLLTACILIAYFMIAGCSEDAPQRPDGAEPPVELLETSIDGAMCFFTNGRGVDTQLTLGYDELHDAIPDTLPYRSQVQFHLSGWTYMSALAGASDSIPIIPRYRYKRWGYGPYETPWYPYDIGASCWDCAAGIDSVMMSVGPYEYRFSARSYDDAGRYDGSPDTIRFTGNFPPEIDTVYVAYDSIPGGEIEFRPLTGDTLYLGIDNPMAYREGVITTHDIDLHFDDYGTLTGYTFSYRFFVCATGHDDPRDPPGSGIKGWRCSFDWAVYEWDETQPLDHLMKEIIAGLYIPFDAANPDTIYSVVDDPPDFCGENTVSVHGTDLGNSEVFEECIRALCHGYDDTCGVIEPGRSVCIPRTGLAYGAPYVSRTLGFYIKLIR